MKGWTQMRLTKEEKQNNKMSRMTENMNDFVYRASLENKDMSEKTVNGKEMFFYSDIIFFAVWNLL